MYKSKNSWKTEWYQYSLASLFNKNAMDPIFYTMHKQTKKLTSDATIIFIIANFDKSVWICYYCTTGIRSCKSKFFIKVYMCDTTIALQLLTFRWNRKDIYLLHLKLSVLSKSSGRLNSLIWSNIFPCTGFPFFPIISWHFRGMTCNLFFKENKNNSYEYSTILFCEISNKLEFKNKFSIFFHFWVYSFLFERGGLLERGVLRKNYNLCYIVHQTWYKHVKFQIFQLLKKILVSSVYIKY